MNRLNWRFNRSFRAHMRRCALVLTLAGLLIALGGCGWDPLGLGNLKIDDILTQVEQTRNAMQQESSAWQKQLQDLQKNLRDMEGKVASDTNDILSYSITQVATLQTQTFEYADALASHAIAGTGAEFRCNSDFIIARAKEQLDSLIEDLKFWKSNKSVPAHKPTHVVCGLVPSEVQLYSTGTNTWSVKTDNMMGQPVLKVYGYNFRDDATPTLKLQNPDGQVLSTYSVLTYGTHYQISSDFSTVNFAGVKSGAKLVFQWPDVTELNTIPVVLLPAAKLRFSNPVFTPTVAIAGVSSVTFRVTIKNEGGSPTAIGTQVYWKPDSQGDPNWQSVLGLRVLNANESDSFTFPQPYIYKRTGAIPSLVTSSSGADPISPSITVNANPPAQIQPCGPYGGQGGTQFSETFDETPVGIRVGSGTRLDSIQMIYASKLGERHGGSGGSPTPINFTPGEYIQGISIRSGAEVDQITIYTNMRTFGPYGGNGGGPNPACGGPGWKVIGINGRSGDRVDALGVTLQRVQ